MGGAESVLLLLVLYSTGDGELLGQRSLGLEDVALGNNLIWSLPDVVVENKSRLVGRGLGQLKWSPRCWLREIDRERERVCVCVCVLSVV